MHWDFSKMIDLFSGESAGQLLLNGKWGFEQETLRVTPDGDLALPPHPEAFGDKENRPYRTTDFSESQMEFITPALGRIEETFSFLDGLKDEVTRELKNKLLWPQSMPGPLPPDDLIPIARYGNTDTGKKKEIYRSGLALRYGKKVQMISGIHYNFSFQDGLWTKLINELSIPSEKQSFINESYAGLVRNVLRYRWLMIYLFGASPVADDNYHKDVAQKPGIHNDHMGSVSSFSQCTRKAISLRMSRFGYGNGGQGKFSKTFIKSLSPVTLYCSICRQLGELCVVSLTPGTMTISWRKPWSRHNLHNGQSVSVPINCSVPVKRENGQTILFGIKIRLDTAKEVETDRHVIIRRYRVFFSARKTPPPPPKPSRAMKKFASAPITRCHPETRNH